MLITQIPVKMNQNMSADNLQAIYGRPSDQPDITILCPYYAELVRILVELEQFKLYKYF